MAAPPLTHHEILKLAEPFTRSGRHVDLAASDRLARKLVFRTVEHPGEAAGAAHIRESLQLQCEANGNGELTRVLTLGSGLQATFRASGAPGAELLALVNQLPPRQQFRVEPGLALARCYTLAAGAGANGGGTQPAQPVFSHGDVQLDGLRLTLNVSTVRGVAAEIALVPAPGNALDIPEDLLAVLGWNWARLVRDRDGWQTRLRLHGGAQRRTRIAVLALDRVATHLARTLAEPPARFHERWVGARWGVVFRRAIPLLTFLALLGAVAATARHARPLEPGSTLYFFQLPTALLALSFCLQELPQLELPPWPRRSAAANWQRPQYG